MNAREAYKKCYSALRYYDTLPLDARDSDDINAELRQYPQLIQDAAWDTYYGRYRRFTGFRRAWMRDYFEAASQHCLCG